MKTSPILLSIAALAGVTSSAALPADDGKVVLRPIHRPDVKPGLLNGLEARQQTGGDQPVVLKPISRPQVQALGIGNNLEARQDTLTPAMEVILGYAANDMMAVVDAITKQPAVVLEDVNGIASVSCSSGAVSMTFSDADALQAAAAAWPASDFLIITYAPDGDCNTADERGWYTVSSLTFDDAALTAIAEGSRTALIDQSEDADIEFDTAGTPAEKRDLSVSVSGELSGTLVEQDNLKVVLDQALFESNIRIRGGFRFNFLKFKPSKMYVDVDYAGLVSLNVSAALSASFSSELLNIDPFSASVSAFTIPGILDVGPIAQFGVGVELAASGTLDASLGVRSEIVNGQVHLDLLDADKSSSSGWTPETSVASDLNAEVTLQLNPYLDLDLALGIRAFKGAIDLTSGVEVKPKIINAFSADLTFAFDSRSGVSFAQPDADTCPNGAWFASTFKMDVNAYVGTFFKKTLFDVNKPIFETQCWSFAG